MTGRLLNLLVALTLMLTVAAAVLWVRSYRQAWGAASSDPERGGTSVTLERGAINASWGPPVRWDWRLPRRPLQFFSFQPFPWRGGPLPDWWFPGIAGGSWPGPEPVPSRLQIVPTHSPTFVMEVSRTEWDRAGFVYQLGLIAYPDGQATLYSRRLRIPPWFTASAIAVVGAIGVRSIGRHAMRFRRRRSGLCRRCGYDLRATPDRCPECGTVADRPPAP